MPYIAIPGFRKVPQTGVIYVMHRAAEKGFKSDDPEWVNLGQGAPETGALEGASSRIEALNIDPSLHEYSPVAGLQELRQKVADLYNSLYRKDKESKYTWENVSIAGGGRIALTRIAASLGNINMGHFLPDYTAYEELLSVFKAFTAIPVLLDISNNYQVSLEGIKNEIMGRGLKALLISNPCNPTGQVVEGEKLKQWLQLARDYQCCLIMDEFYSHYIYGESGKKNLPKMVSAAEYVDNVDHDPVIIVDGITKNWRYPGWRISWTLAPKEVIRTIASAGSFLDGGACNPMQKEVISLLDPERVLQEAAILQKCFVKKRDYALERLAKMGIIVETPPNSTFYIWANLSQLPEAIADGMRFLEAGLDEKAITVPGIFFDVNPEKRRSHARFQHHTRISFGPNIDELKRGLDALERVINKHKI
jgi:aspartate/methionine/tyrosine aminotransferase